MLLDDAAGRHPFSEDDYFRQRGPRSALCLPIVRQARLLGVLYLENRLITGAFTPGRLTVLELLASQSAISLENAMLYADIEQENAERRRAEQELQANQATLQAIVDNSAASIYLKDRDGRYPARQLPRVRRAVGHAAPMGSSERPTPRSCPPRPPSCSRTTTGRCSTAGEPLECEEEILLDGGPHTFLSVKFPLGESVMPGVICGISTDITERKRAELRRALPRRGEPQAHGPRLRRHPREASRSSPCPSWPTGA